MENIPIAKGGRGRTAPYATVHYRIPKPIKPTVERLAATYREWMEEVREPEALLERVEEAIDPRAKPTQSLEDKHQITQLLQKIAKLEEQNEISAKLLNHARQDKQESLEEAAQKIAQQQVEIERLKLTSEKPAANAQESSLKKELTALEQENLELHSKVGDLDLALCGAKEEIEALNGRISYLLDERGLAQMKANDDARIDIERLQALNNQLEEENAKINKAYTESEVLSQRFNSQRFELKAENERLKQLLLSPEKGCDDKQLDRSKAATILKEALALKANAGGAIKTKIKEALLIFIPDRD